MICWVLYDIENDRARTKAAKCCKQAGLYRVQLSVFLGEISTTGKDALQLQLEELINPDKDKAYIFSMSRDELRQTALLGQAFDKKLVSGQVKALFL
ncbi:MAG: CRISPR-associated endonuclease Cas2 [Phaeodactylibacter sp.]|nr:CRISPR-associated endonuclease Cas2 [Phaeodactylibacter sp.]MCB9300392.1 CRISPR-associated endonuclease Cas2 [Lewinellaceae bacterium]